MSIPDKSITISIFYEGESHLIKTYPFEYRNLMMLIYDKLFLEGFGECLGMGKCGTCLIEIRENPQYVSFFDRNEETTMSRAGITAKHVRLACQILIDEGIDGLKVNIL